MHYVLRPTTINNPNRPCSGKVQTVKCTHATHAAFNSGLTVIFRYSYCRTTHEARRQTSKCTGHAQGSQALHKRTSVGVARATRDRRGTWCAVLRTTLHDEHTCCTGRATKLPPHLQAHSHSMTSRYNDLVDVLAFVGIGCDNADEVAHAWQWRKTLLAQ